MARNRTITLLNKAYCPKCGGRSWRKTLAKWGSCANCRSPSNRLVDCPICNKRTRVGTLEKYQKCHRCYYKTSYGKNYEIQGEEKKQVIKRFIRWLEARNKASNNERKRELLIEQWLQERENRGYRRSLRRPYDG